MRYKIECYGVPLVSVNNRYKMLKIRGKYVIGNSEEYKEFIKNLMMVINATEKPVEAIDAPIKTIIHVGTYKDIDNVIKPIHDCLEKTGFIKNDRNIIATDIRKTPLKRGETEWLEIEVLDSWGKDYG